MRQVHPSYEMFVDKQVPKYGKSFIDWYSENQNFGGVNFLDELNRRTNTANSNYSYSTPTCYFDFFTKKLIVCKGILDNVLNYSTQMKYGIDRVADIMDLYEDVIQTICEHSNVGLCQAPSGIYNSQAFTTSYETFYNLDAFKTYLSTGIVIIYHFYIMNDRSIQCRTFKHEVITRNVIFEKTYV